mmetsp:Transcript_36729/g.84764  ORF Transcript_36729/g.84764 Transcript_36729/m.84764 type:complete len:213 (-) Transcript_36729:369-1007(-)
MGTGGICSSIQAPAESLSGLFVPCQKGFIVIVDDADTCEIYTLTISTFAWVAPALALTSRLIESQECKVRAIHTRDTREVHARAVATVLRIATALPMPSVLVECKVGLLSTVDVGEVRVIQRRAAATLKPPALTLARYAVNGKERGVSAKHIGNIAEVNVTAEAFHFSRAQALSTSVGPHQKLPVRADHFFNSWEELVPNAGGFPFTFLRLA